MIRAFTEGFLQLKDPKVFALVVRSALLTLTIYVLLFAALIWLLRSTEVSALPWLDTLADWGAGLAAALVAAILFPGLVSAILSVFLETVAAAVEGRHYPTLGPARSIPLAEMLSSSLRLGLWTLGLNLLLLPVYLVLFFLPPLNIIFFAGVNGRILGREYFETVALRRLPADRVKELRLAHAGTLWLAGAITAGALTIPVLNLVMPVVGVAAMVHLFHKLTRLS